MGPHQITCIATSFLHKAVRRSSILVNNTISTRKGIAINSPRVMYTRHTWHTYLCCIYPTQAFRAAEPYISLWHHRQINLSRLLFSSVFSLFLFFYYVYSTLSTLGIPDSGLIYQPPNFPPFFDLPNLGFPQWPDTIKAFNS